MTAPRARIGARVVRLEEATSTNSLILDNEDWLNEHGLVVTARHQTAGRGRLGRRWASVPGAQLQFSVVVHWRGRAEALGLVSLAAVTPRLKWPNDVLLAGRKVCGVLIESKPGAGGLSRLVAGIGINVLGGAEDFPPELRPLLTTLAEQAGVAPDGETLMRQVLERLHAHLARLEQGNRAPMLSAWRARADLAGRPVRITAGNQVSEGRAAGIDDDGGLLVEGPDGSRQRHVSGEVQWL